MLSPLRSGQLNRLMQPQEFETAIIQFELNIQKMIKWRATNILTKNV